MTTTSLVALGGLHLVPGALAEVTGNQQRDMIQEGRYDELVKGLEQDRQSGIKLRTADLHALCVGYSETKNYSKLFPCLEGVEKLVKAGDRRSRIFRLEDVTPDVHIRRARGMLELRQYSRSVEEAQLALAWYKRDQSDYKDIEIKALGVLFLALHYSENPAEARQALSRLEAVNTSWLYKDYNNAKTIALLKANLALGEYQKVLDIFAADSKYDIRVALDDFFSGAKFQGKSNWVWSNVPRLYIFSRALLGLGRKAEARESYDRLLGEEMTQSNGEIYWLALLDRGSIASAEGKAKDAADYFSRAVDVIETQRATLNTEVDKIGFLGDKQSAYASIVGAYFTLGNYEKALEYVERSKARALVDLLAAKKDFAAPKNPGRAAELLAKYDQADADARLQVPLAAGTDTLRNFVVVAGTALRMEYPQLASLVSVAVEGPQRTRGRLAGNEALVEYFFDRDNLYAFVVLASGVQGFKLPRGGMESEVDDLHRAIVRRGPEAIPVSQSLWARLVKPLTLPEGTQRLIVVPHGVLHYVPFNALFDGRGFLLERFEVRSLPSASVLEFIPRAKVRQLSQTLILGSPQTDRAPLPFAEIEARQIAEMSKQSKLFLGANASETLFKDLAAEFQTIHVAAHGLFRSDAPLTSALDLTPDASNDGLLTVGELYQLAIDADLVTLSACETGLGKVQNGDDVIGLTRGFIYAGARNVVASLWKVQDRATAELMTGLYRNSAKDATGAALRNAQLQVKATPGFAHPFFWAPFVLYGVD